MTDLQKSYEAEILWQNPILQAVLDEMRQDNYKAFQDAPAESDRLMKVKMMGYAIEAFASRLEAMTVDAMRDRAEQNERSA